TPARISILMPWPSRALKALKASPAGPYQSLPSVRTPSTSNSIRRTRLARCCASPFFSFTSDDFGAEQVVHVERADQLAARVDHQQLVDLVALHDLHRFGGERLGPDAARPLRHYLRDPG